MLIEHFITILIGGFVLGWKANETIYGLSSGCRDCFVALVRGRKCSECDYNTFPDKAVD